MEAPGNAPAKLDLQLRSPWAAGDWHTINFRKLRLTLSNSLYTSFPQWADGNLKSLASHLRVLDFELQAPNDAEVNDKGSTYVAYTADDCAIFLAALPLHSTDEPNYEAGTNGTPGPHRWQRSQITVKGSMVIRCSLGFRISSRSVRIRAVASFGELRAEHQFCVAVSGGSTQSVEQSRKRQLPGGASSVKRAQKAATSPAQPATSHPIPLPVPTAATAADEEKLVVLQRLLRCGQWHEFDQRLPTLRAMATGPCSLQAQILLSSRHMYMSTAADLADPHHPAWREFTKADKVLQESDLGAEVRYLAHLLTLYRKAHRPFSGQHQMAYDRLATLVTLPQIPPVDAAAGYFTLALAPAPSLDEAVRVNYISRAIKAYCETNHPDDLAHAVIALAYIRMSRKPGEGFQPGDPLTHIPPGPLSVLGADYEQVCCDLRQLNHKVMSLLTQADYWMVWADVLLRGGRLALATQMCLHCIKVAESVQPPFVEKVQAAKDRLNVLRTVAPSPPLLSHAKSADIVPASLLLELGLSHDGAKTKTQAQAHSASTQHLHAGRHAASHHQPHTHIHTQAHTHTLTHGGTHSAALQHSHSHMASTPHQAHIAADPHGHVHSGHVHAELHAHSGHVHSHHTHGKGIAAIISRPTITSTHPSHSSVCSLSSSDLAGSCAPCSAEKAPVCMDEIHCDGECCELLDWEIQLASCCCNSQHEGQ